jgi:hypothetical protein
MSKLNIRKNIKGIYNPSQNRNGIRALKAETEIDHIHHYHKVKREERVKIERAGEKSVKYTQPIENKKRTKDILEA